MRSSSSRGATGVCFGVGLISAAIGITTVAQTTRPTTTPTTAPTTKPTTKPTTRPEAKLPTDDVIRIDDAAMLIATAQQARLDASKYVKTLLQAERLKPWTQAQFDQIERLLDIQTRYWAEIMQNRAIDDGFRGVVQQELDTRVADLERQIREAGPSGRQP